MVFGYMQTYLVQTKLIVKSLANILLSLYCRKVCDNCEKKKLKPVCDKVQRKVCSYKPEESCHEEKKQYCFKTEKIIIDKVCVGEKKEVYDESFSYV